MSEREWIAQLELENATSRQDLAEAVAFSVLVYIQCSAFSRRVAQERLVRLVGGHYVSPPPSDGASSRAAKKASRSVYRGFSPRSLARHRVRPPTRRSGAVWPGAPRCAPSAASRRAPPASCLAGATAPRMRDRSRLKPG